MVGDRDHLEPWLFRPAIGEDSGFAETFARETEAFTRVLLASSSAEKDFTDDLFLILSPAGNNASPAASSSSSCSDTVKELRRPAGKIAKRKSRSPKKGSRAAYLTAAPENFRDLVQQMTGVQFGNRVPAPATVTRRGAPPPPPPPPDGVVPTLDTSALWLASLAAPHLGSSDSFRVMGN